MRARMLWVAAALVGAGVLPVTADAAVLVKSGGTLTYTGQPGEPNSVEFEPSGPVVYVGPMKGTVTGCDQVGPTMFACLNINSITADLGDGDDRAWAGGPFRSALSGGPGDDDLILFAPGNGSVLSGGPGIDTAVISSRAAEPISITLDDVANDGVKGSSVNVAPDVENLSAQSVYWPNGALVADRYGPITLTGDADANELTSDDGNDTLTGGAGSDVLIGRGGDDTLDARDGELDRVECGAGTDTALVDQLDQVSDSCEHVQVQVTPSPEPPPPPAVQALDDQPPRVAFNPGTALAVTASDDRGVASVRFMAGETTLCTDTTAPYTCDFRPGVKDVGRRTIVAVAVDAAGQTATAIRTLVVSRFVPRSVSLTVKRQGKRFVASGKVALPAGIACTGTVTVKAGKTTRTGKLSRTCTFRVVLPSGGRFVATYGGTTAIEPKRSAARSAR
jgi:Ca2+-binding RTX toxin-like protein